MRATLGATLGAFEGLRSEGGSAAVAPPTVFLISGGSCLDVIGISKNCRLAAAFRACTVGG